MPRPKGPKFYAVRTGLTPGVYHTYDDCLAQVKGFKGAVFKSFPSLTEAEAFVKSEGGPQQAGSAKKFYAVHSGIRPGVYNTWDEAKLQITGSKRPLFKAFTSQQDAEDYVKHGPTSSPAPRTPASALPEEISTGTTSTKRPASSIDETPSRSKLPPAKKQKKSSGNTAAVEDEIDESLYEPGTGPLPPGAEDGFDPRVKLRALGPESFAPIEYKDYNQRDTWKMQAVALRYDTCIDVYTDGACKNNGKRAAGPSAGWGVFFGDYDRRNGFGRVPGDRQTNQRAELLAIQRALELVPKDKHVRIITDSQYSISCATDWSKRWKLNGWKSALGKPVENRDLIEAVVTMIDERASLGVETRFLWTKGHAGNPGNIAADRLAVQGAMLPLESEAIPESPLNSVNGDEAEGVRQEEIQNLPSPPPEDDEDDYGGDLDGVDGIEDVAQDTTDGVSAPVDLAVEDNDDVDIRDEESFHTPTGETRNGMNGHSAMENSRAATQEL